MKKTLLSAALLLLSSCDGPWNTMPHNDPVPDPVLRLSLFAVGGKSWDTLHLDRTQPLDLTYDSTRAFVQSATVEVWDSTDGRRAMTWHLATPSAVLWAPDSQASVQAGHSYAVHIHATWNADPDWPVSSTIKTTDLVAATAVPASYSIEKQVKVPAEMLIPQFAAGTESGPADSILDSLERRMPGWAARWNLDVASVDSLKAGLPVYRVANTGDTLWYISGNDAKVWNPDGKQVGRAYRPLLLGQHPGPNFAGVFTVDRFDPNQAWILNAVTRQFMATLGRTSWTRADSAQLYQAGDTYYGYGPYPAFAPDLSHWPEVYTWSNLTFGYTGRNTMYFYSTDTQYIVYQSQLSKQAQGDKTSLPYTNVRGGNGYFAAALVDSVQFFIRAEGVQTFQVQALRSAACRESYANSRKNGTPFQRDPVCTGIALE
jgi:hypothetical protein